MDVTNPGLVNVADQVAGNPSVAPAGSTLAVPRQGDVLEPVADDGYPVGVEVSQALDAATTTFPTPVEVLAGSEAPATLPQDIFGQVPGTAPLYAPTPQVDLANTVAQQQFPGVNTTEFVVGPDSNIQVNRNDESERGYLVTSVLDADTGGPVVDPSIPVTGTFSAVFDGGSGTLTVVSPAPFPPSIVDGITVNVASSSGAPVNTNASISSVTSLAGTVSAASPSTGGKVTVSSPTALPAGLVDGQPVTLATGVPAYDGAKSVSGVTNAAGTFAKVATFSGGMKSLVVSPTTVPAALQPGKFATVAGGVYAGTFKVDSLGTAQGANFDTAASDGGGGTTFHCTTPLPAELAAGQSVTVAGGVYAGTYVVTGFDTGAQTFDLAVAFSATDAGTWVQSGNYAFVLDVAFSLTDSGTWKCHTFDVVAAYSVTAVGTWTSYTFKVPGTYVATAAGSWAFTPVTNFTTRYRLGVKNSDGSPADLNSFGISLLGRELVFDDPTLTAADSGASRLVAYYGAAYVVINRSDPDDDSVPVMTKPQANDSLTLFVQREGSEVFTDLQGQVTNVTVAPPPPTFVPNPAQSLQSQGNVDVTVGPQPGEPVPTSGVWAPTARTVNVADQATVVGLPRNVFI
jgi:hypothetical protein